MRIYLAAYIGQIEYRDYLLQIDEQGRKKLWDSATFIFYRSGSDLILNYKRACLKQDKPTPYWHEGRKQKSIAGSG